MSEKLDLGGVNEYNTKYAVATRKLKWLTLVLLRSYIYVFKQISD